RPPRRRASFAEWLLRKGWGAERAGITADELWDIAALPRLPHEVIPGLENLDTFTALRFAVSVRRARLRWRKYQAEEALKALQGDKDPLGVGRVIALLGIGAVEG